MLMKFSDIVILLRSIYYTNCLSFIFYPLRADAIQTKTFASSVVMSNW
jgi:hypothetical protein